METFTLKVIGFSRVFYEGEAVQVQLPIQDGSMGIMAHHEAAVIGIVPGTMRLQTPDGEWQRDDVPPKPAPDLVFRALETLGVDAADAIYVGDSEVDVATARNAGLPLAAVSWGFRGRRALAEAQEELRQKHSVLECQNAEMTILRSLARLHAKGIFLS